jgi:DNA-binding CsgD family transcriptional regulator
MADIIHPRRKLKAGDVCETDDGRRVRLTGYRPGGYRPWIAHDLADGRCSDHNRDDLTLVERGGSPATDAALPWTGPRPLTVREQQIVVCRCLRDLTGNETGAELGISGQTVKNHVTHILRALGAKSMYGVCFRMGKQLGRIEARKEATTEDVAT